MSPRGKEETRPQPLATRCLDLVTRVLHLLWVWPLVNFLFQQFSSSHEPDLRVSIGAEASSIFYFGPCDFSLQSPLSLVCKCCRQMQHESTTLFILYSLWTRADNKVGRIQSDVMRGFSYQSLRFLASSGSAYKIIISLWCG